MRFQSTKGFTLLELVLAMALSGMLSLEMLHLLLRIQRESTYQQQYISTIHRFLFLTDYLTQQVQAADQIILADLQHLILRQHGFSQKFFIAKTAYDPKISSLYQQINEERRQELAHAIIAMHSHETKANIAIWLLARSEQRVSKQKTIYFFDGQYYAVQDGYLYFAWPIYIKKGDKFENARIYFAEYAYR